MNAKILGRQLAELRWIFGISTAALSHKVGIPESTLCAIEAGRDAIDRVTLHDICSGLQISPQELLELTDCRSETEFDRLSDSDYEELRLPQLKSIEDYRQARRWYRLRQARSEWIARKRAIDRKKRALQLKTFQAARLSMRLEREAATIRRLEAASARAEHEALRRTERSYFLPRPY